MTTATYKSETALQIRKILNAPRDKVFRAWTDPNELKKWHAPEDQFTVPFAEVDLRVGGKYRIGMKPNKDDKDVVHIVGGIYKEIRAPEKLVFSWIWEDKTFDIGETLITIEFIDKGNNTTEIIFTHDLFPNDKVRDHHKKGWNGCINRLERIF